MKQVLHAITIRVKDIDKMKAFYSDQFGWKVLNDNNTIALFILNGVLLTLYPENEFAAYLQLLRVEPGAPTFYFTINFNSEEEVDNIFIELEKKDVNIIKAPQKVFWDGYSGFISDIENNYWEIAYNPFLVLNNEDKVISHR